MNINDLEQDRTILVAKGADQAKQEKQSCKFKEVCTMDLPTIAITEEMLEPLVQGVIANVSVVLPVGLNKTSPYL